MRLSLVSWLVAGCVCAAGTGARGAVTLVSAELTRESKGTTKVSAGSPPPETRYHEIIGPDPFPNDANNFASVGPEGLTVGVDLQGTFSHAVGLNVIEDVNDYRFQVVFDVDHPAPFTFSRAHTSGPFDVDGPMSLRLDGQPPVQLFYSDAGTLAPGRYTFSGDTDLLRLMGASGLPRSYNQNNNFAGVRLTVLPEPSLGVALAGGLLILCPPRRPGSR
jgi:hypothetical protein